MRFIKDLLFFDVNATGADTDKDSVVQLSAILVDKNNLLEKDYFNAYIRVSYLDSVIFEHAKLLGIEAEVLRKSPKVFDAVKQFRAKFGDRAMLATHNVANLMFLKSSFKKAGLPFDFDPHVVELWTLGYVYALNYGLKKMPSFATFLDYFKLKVKNPADALERTRLEVEIFKKIIKEA
ncbi:MAG: exonuclease domain-containing protein [Patescibacteria group bacterium]|nr:exonuclease domain-containing protein [Patescibacteria group bacterium]